MTTATVVMYPLSSAYARALWPGQTRIAENGGRFSLRPCLDARKLWGLAWLALPIGLAQGIVSLKTNTPRYFIDSHLGASELGIFTALAYIMVGGKMIREAMTLSIMPRLSRCFAGGKYTEARTILWRLIVGSAVMGGAGVTVACLFGNEILTILYRPEYARKDVLIVLMVAGGISYVASSLGEVATAARYFRVQLPLLACVVASVAIASYWLVPERGIIGAAFALVIGELVALLGQAAVTLYVLRALCREAKKAEDLAPGRLGPLTEGAIKG